MSVKFVRVEECVAKPEDTRSNDLIGLKRKVETSYDCLEDCELRTLLRSRGLEEHGNREELISRLLEPTFSKKTKIGTCPKIESPTTLRVSSVDRKFAELGYIPRKISSCVKSAVLKGYIKLESLKDSLETVICEGKFCCEENLQVRLKDILLQKDDGSDHEEGGDGAGIKCSQCSLGIYVTRICQNAPVFDDGRNHKHCSVCPDFGCCIGDFRLSHCQNCQKHYFRGESDLECMCVTSPNNRVKDECVLQ